MLSIDCNNSPSSLLSPALIQTLNPIFLNHQTKIEHWFENQWNLTPPPFYCSVDLRNAGFKLAPVDTNLFPAGFNNLNSESIDQGISAIQSAIKRICPTAKRLLLLPENHTRNVHYLENIVAFIGILENAGFLVKIGSIDPKLTEKQVLTLPSQSGYITIHPTYRKNNRLQINEFDPDVIINNNDLSAGISDRLKDIHQPIVPPPSLGWSLRLKSNHFQRYKSVAYEFGDLINLDPWLVMPLFRHCGEINFMKREGEDCLVKNANLLLQAIEEKYRAYGISHQPFVVVKADSGTYGMSVMMVNDVSMLRHLNRKQRTKMATSKGGKQVTQVMIQEGVYSFEAFGHHKSCAEPVIYMIDRYVIGGFYRVHDKRNAQENLNAPGMYFSPLPYQIPYAYGVIARLALVSAGRELSLQPPSSRT